MAKTRVHKIYAALLALGMTFPALADWNINNDASSLHFMSTKNAQVTEIHKFDKFTGSLTDEGKLHVAVDLSSVNTAIDIRDTRMQEMLFNVSEYAEATFDASLPEEMLNLATGEVVTGYVDGTLSLHGNQVDTRFSVMVSKVSENTLTVSTTSPTLVKAESFGLSKGIAALQAIAGLKSITTTVPVTFAITLTQ